MARSTARTVGPKSTEKCSACNVRAEATVTNGTTTLRVCAVHVENHLVYAEIRGLTITFDPESNLAICVNCRRVIGLGARAAHRCEAR